MYLTTGLLGMLTFTMCRNSPLSFQQAKINRQEWYTHAPAVFELPVYDKDHEADVHIWLRTTTDYEFSSITLIATAECDNRTIWTDTIPLAIYDQRGKNTGSGFPFTENKVKAKPLHIKAGKTYKVKIRHAMRCNPIKGVTDCGIRLSANEKND